MSVFEKEMRTPMLFKTPSTLVLFSIKSSRWARGDFRYLRTGGVLRLDRALAKA